MCRYGIWKAKAHLELNLSMDMRRNKKGIYRFLKNKRMRGENVGPGFKCSRGCGDKGHKKIKATLLNDVFTSVFTGKIYLQESHPLETRGKSGIKKT